MVFTPEEMSKLQNYLTSKFGNPNITLRPRKNVTDSVEVLLKGEFIGTLYKDTDDGETSYDFNMAILDIDVNGAS
jgi:hypothetical protein